MTAETVKEPTCEQCRSAGASPQLATRSIDRVFNFADVLQRVSGRQSTQFTHAVNELICRYSLPSLIECALPDETLHKDGCVIRTVCGLTLQIGHECGKKWIPGLEEALKHDIALDKVERKKATVRDYPNVCAEAERVAADVRLLSHLVHAIERRIPDLASSMRWIAQHPKENRVEIDREGLDKRRVTEVFTIAGVGLFSEAPDADRLRNGADYVRAECAPVVDNLDEDTAIRLAREVKSVAKRARETRLWCDRARPFFAPMNLAIALRHAEVDNVEVKDGMLVVRGVGIGLRGLVTDFDEESDEAEE